nr:hypothetical protein [Rhizobiaceae bacterium]
RLVGAVAAFIAWLVIGAGESFTGFAFSLTPGAVGGACFVFGFLWRRMANEPMPGWFRAGVVGFLGVLAAYLPMWVVAGALELTYGIEPGGIGDFVSGTASLLLVLVMFSVAFTFTITFPIGIGAALLLCHAVRRANRA